MTDDSSSPTDEAAEQILAFAERMEALHVDLREASRVWDVAGPSSGALPSKEVWADADENTHSAAAAAAAARAKWAMRLFGKDSSLRRLAGEVAGASRGAADAYLKEMESLIPHEERIRKGSDAALARMDEIVKDAGAAGKPSPSQSREFELQAGKLKSLNSQRRLLTAHGDLFLVRAPLLKMLPGFEAALKKLDRTAAARRRQRRVARILHPIVQFVVLLLLGVVAVNLVSDRLSDVGSIWVWAFAIASFVAIDYFIEPWIERQRHLRATALLQRELDATQEVVESIPHVLATAFMVSSGFPQMQALRDEVVSLGQEFLPKAEAFVRMVKEH
jgi:hypothetical protein